MLGSLLRILVVVVVAVDEHDDVRVLSMAPDSLGLIHHGALSVPFCSTEQFELRARSPGITVPLSPASSGPRDLAELDSRDLSGCWARAAHELQVVHHDQPQLATGAPGAARWRAQLGRREPGVSSMIPGSRCAGARWLSQSAATLVGNLPVRRLPWFTRPIRPTIRTANCAAPHFHRRWPRASPR